MQQGKKQNAFRMPCNAMKSLRQHPTLTFLAERLRMASISRVTWIIFPLPWLCPDPLCVCCRRPCIINHLARVWVLWVLLLKIPPRIRTLWPVLFITEQTPQADWRQSLLIVGLTTLARHRQSQHSVFDRIFSRRLVRQKLRVYQFTDRHWRNYSYNALGIRGST
jgi:hypothetical protein